jgi:hypothetical protein
MALAGGDKAEELMLEFGISLCLSRPSVGLVAGAEKPPARLFAFVLVRSAARPPLGNRQSFYLRECISSSIYHALAFCFEPVSGPLSCLWAQPSDLLSLEKSRRCS